MQNWINRVFVNGKYWPGGMAKRDLAATKAEFQKKARQVLNETDADHVVYCYIEYNAEGDIMVARFYTLKMNDEEFYKETGELTGDHYVGAVHRLK